MNTQYEGRIRELEEQLTQLNQLKVRDSFVKVQIQMEIDWLEANKDVKRSGKSVPPLPF